MHKFAIVDIETTGVYAQAHSITEIAIILHDGNKVIDSFQTLINPGTSISPYVTSLTGISYEMVKDAPAFHEAARKIWEMTDDAIFVAHSVNFDYSFIREEFKSLGADFKRKKLCTVRLSRKIFPGHSSYSLGNICSILNIPIQDRHRAMGDAQATVKLLEECMKNDKENFILKSLKKDSREAVLPPHLPKEIFDSLPEKTGVYYFHDVHGKVIYVGKAINIKKRIYSHITGSGSTRLSFISAIANITYTICGTELIALLLESNEIKRLYPLYNRAQKSGRGTYVLSDYYDVKGIHHLMFTNNYRSLKPVASFKSFTEAREFMFHLIEKFELCPKYCGMQTSSGACFDYQVKKCKGICAGIEQINEYNERVQMALSHLENSQETKLIIDEGRSFNEKSVVLIENGQFLGFGYFDSSLEMNKEKAKEIIQPYRHTADIQKILNGWMNKKEILA